MRTLLVIFLFLPCSLQATANGNISGNLRPGHFTDSSILVKELNGSKLYLSAGIKDWEFWTRVCAQDTVIISHFAKRGKEPSFIFITNITSVSGGYIFRILARPDLKVSDPEKLARQLRGIGYAYYRVTTMLDVKPVRTKIISFEFSGIEI